MKNIIDSLQPLYKTLNFTTMKKLTKKEIKQVVGGDNFWGHFCTAPNPAFSGCYALKPDFTCVECVWSEEPCMGPFLLTSAGPNGCL